MVKTGGLTLSTRRGGLSAQLTSGLMGGVRVPFLRPSQLNPSNHLDTEHKAFESWPCFYVQHSNASSANSLVFLDVFNAALLVPQSLRRIISAGTNVSVEKRPP